MLKFTLRSVENADIFPLAKLYMEIYQETNNIEKWTIQSSNEFITYYYNQCKELFFVAECDDILVGGIWGQIKPWWSGNKVYNLEVFIKKEYQRQGLSKLLFRKIFNESIKQYQAITVEAITFNDRPFPLAYYEKIALRKDEQLVLLEGTISEILKNLN